MRLRHDESPNEVRALRVRADKFEGQAAFEQKQKDGAVLAAERSVGPERESREESAAVVRGLSADIERSAKARDADVAQLQRDLITTLHDAREPARRLEVALAACREDREASVATARVIEGNAAGLYQQLRKLEANFLDYQRRDDLDRVRLVDTARKELDALLHLLTKHAVVVCPLPLGVVLCWWCAAAGQQQQQQQQQQPESGLRRPQ